MRLPGELGAAGAAAIVPIDVLARALQASSVVVAGAATGVKRIASELAAGSSEQAASVVEIAAAVEELAQTAAQFAATEWAREVLDRFVYRTEGDCRQRRDLADRSGCSQGKRAGDRNFLSFCMMLRMLLLIACLRGGMP